MANLSFKAQPIAHKLADILKARGYTLTESFDTDGYPLVSVGPGTNGGKNAIFKVLPTGWPLQTDVLGNTANSYGPHSVLIATEADSAGTGIAAASGWQFLADMLFQGMLTGCHIDIYQSANGTAPTASTFSTASNLKASFDPDIYHALISQQ